MEYLTNLYNTISGDPLIIIILLAILLFVGYAIVKKLFKVAVFVVICLAIYLGYIAFTEGPDAAIGAVKDSVDSVLSDDIKDDLNNIKKQVIDKTDGILDFMNDSPNPSEKQP